MPANYSFTRKAAYQYGWDWGPRILTLGIWKPVKVFAYKNTRLENIRITNSPIRKLNDRIKIGLEVDVFDADTSSDYFLDFNIVKKSNNESIGKDQITIKPKSERHILHYFNVTIDKDTIWWTWDLGKPNLIDVFLTLTNKNSQETFNFSLTTGLRTVTVIQEDQQFNGTSFKFNLNGYDVYMRGGNYIPPEMSMARVKK